MYECVWMSRDGLPLPPALMCSNLSSSHRAAFVLDTNSFDCMQRERTQVCRECKWTVCFSDNSVISDLFHMGVVCLCVSVFKDMRRIS